MTNDESQIALGPGSWYRMAYNLPRDEGAKLHSSLVMRRS
jgi:hypothetical protein